jgi:methionine-gamma-lyase
LFGGVNPSISDSYLHFPFGKTMFDTFEGNMEGCYLYSRHSSPSNLYLDSNGSDGSTETANVSASGMGAITPTLQLVGLETTSYQVEQFMEEHMLF